jgi:PAT family beta-lactamase induction signal transducer AmpG
LQALLAVALIIVAQFSPDKDLYLIAIMASLIAFLSASQDIVIDAYRIEIVDGDDQGYSAAAYVFGYRTSNFVANIGVLALAEFYGWTIAIMALTILLLPGAIAALLIGEPGSSDESDFLKSERKANEGSVFVQKFREAVILPFKEFIRRPNWWLVLLFIFLYKAGDAVTSIMTSPLIVEMGYSNLDIAWANKTVGFITLMVGVGLGAMLYKKIGMFRALFLSGILMMLTNLVFAWLSAGEALDWRLAVTIGAENFATGLGTTVIIAYYANLCNVNFTATQFALLSSLGNQARTLLGAPSGFVAEAVGWVEFFIYATMLAIPGLILLGILWKLDIRAQKE